MSETKYIKTRTVNGLEAWEQVSALVSGSMVYPGAGIALSSGTGWGASITNNSANWNTAFGWGNHASAGYAPLASPTFTGTVTLPASTTVPDGGTIGQAAGPLLTFDDTLNYLEITGCKVGIVQTAPAYTLDVTGNIAVGGVGNLLYFDTTGARASCSIFTSNDYWLNISNSRGTSSKIILKNTPAISFETGGFARMTLTDTGLGIGTITPNAKLESLSTTEQLRLSYDATHYTKFEVAAAGGMTITPLAGTSLNIVCSTTGNFIVNTDDLVVDTSSGFAGIGFTTPLSALCINGGLHVGGESAAGDNNLLVDGTCGITGVTTLTGYTNTVGGIHVGGVADPGDDNLLVDGTGKFIGNTQHPDFTSGWGIGTGVNWQIKTNGDAEFENLLVRGSARFRELIIDELSIIAGSNLMSVARGKIASIEIDYNEEEEIVDRRVVLEDPNNRGACSFEANDFFWIKNVDIDKNLFTDCRGQITNVTGVTLTLSFSVAGGNGEITDVSKGDVIVQRGNSTEADRQSLIYTTVSDANSPFERIMTGIDSLAAFSTLSNIVLQYGDLTSLASQTFGNLVMPADPGHGFFSDNCYLSGKIVASSGLIGAFTINATSIYTGTEDHAAYTANAGDLTIYSDGSDASIHAYNFYVSSAGNIYAKGGEIGGFTLSATSLLAGALGSAGWCTIDSTGLFGLSSLQSYCYSQQTTPVTLTAPVYYAVALDNNAESTLNLPASGLPGSGTSTSMIIIHAYGTGLGAGKYHIQGNGYKVNRGGVNANSFDLDEGEAVLIVWDPRQGGQWYAIG